MIKKKSLNIITKRMQFLLLLILKILGGNFLGFTNNDVCNVFLCFFYIYIYFTSLLFVVLCFYLGTFFFLSYCRNLKQLPH